MAITRAERAAATRLKILDVAVEHFLAQPYDEVSVHDLANAAGVAYGLVAHHFGNKRGIHREAIREAVRRLEQHSPPPGPAASRIRILTRVRFTSIEQLSDVYFRADARC